jgi:hypothetical protein
MARHNSRPPELAIAALTVLTSVLLLSWMPPAFSMLIAVFGAISWCIWLDRHPSA